MRPCALVTGVAGFIGSHMAESLVRRGYRVVGVDRFADEYPRWVKERNIGNLRLLGDFDFRELDLAHDAIDNLDVLLQDSATVFHMAARHSAPSSGDSGLNDYVMDNIVGTQRLLEWCRKRNPKKFLYASTLAVYGDGSNAPTKEDDPVQPISLYGATKLAGERLCRRYWSEFGLPVVILRYSTVYGPRQRPGMAFYRFLDALFAGDEIEIHGDGKQVRDFSYVLDIVEATILSMESPDGEILNIGTGRGVTLGEALRTMEEIVGRRARVRMKPPHRSDVRHSCADISKAKSLLRYHPRFELKDGLSEQVKWMRQWVCRV
jgi:nucleoside-diphosphate-sugar epimerase